MNDIDKNELEDDPLKENSAAEPRDEDPVAVLGFEIHAPGDMNEKADNDTSEGDDLKSNGDIPATVLGYEIQDSEDDETRDQADSSESISQKLDGIQQKLEQLDKEFQSKLTHDAHKNKIIDDLHEELLGYRNDLANKQFQSIILEMIKIIDDIRKLTAHYRSIDPSECDPVKLLQLLESIPSDLEDICNRQGVDPFTCGKGVFDPSRQKMLEKVETDDKAKDKTIAESLRPGYECDGKIIRPEIVSVFVCSETADDAETGNSDE